jgi:hypothetical protein
LLFSLKGLKGVEPPLFYIAGNQLDGLLLGFAAKILTQPDFFPQGSIENSTPCAIDSKVETQRAECLKIDRNEADAAMMLTGELTPGGRPKKSRK